MRGRLGKFEHADAGTLSLFLDQVSDLALSAQAKLLRAIQDLAVERVGGTGLRRVDTRIVVATNRPLSELVTYFLARHRVTRDLSMSEAALDALRLHDWPGNVRELERLIERAVSLVTTNRIELEDLPPQVCGRYGEVLGPSIAGSESLRAWGSRYARLVFERCGRNKRAASRLLDISYHTLEAYLGYGHSGRPSKRRVPAWARAARDPGDLDPADE